MGAQGGLYLGDTADDHDLVRHYRASKIPREPEILSAICATSWQQARLYRERGAAILLSSVNELLHCSTTERVDS